MKKISLKLVAATLMLTSGPLIAGQADNKLEALMDKHWQGVLERSPIGASMFGATVDNTALDRLDDNAFKANIKAHDQSIIKLAKIDFDKLSKENRVNYQVFKWMIENERKLLDHNGRYFTFNTVGGWHTNFVQLVATTRLTSEKDYEDLLSRFNAFGRFADENMALMRKGIETGYVQPCETLIGYESSISGFVSMPVEKSAFYAPFTRIPEVYGTEKIDDLQARAKQVINDVIYPKYNEYASFFTNTYKPACRKVVGLSSVPGGAEMYETLVDYYTTIDTDPDTVHKLGLSEVRRIRGEMQEIMDKVGFEGDLKAFFEFLATDSQFYTANEKEYLSHAAYIAKQIDGKMPEFFSYLPRMPYGLLPIPEAMAPKATTAYYQPGAADGSRAGVYRINLYDLKSRPLFELTALTLHEGVPGHHNQIMISTELESLPAFRRAYYFHAYGEGWGLYSERLGEEMGVYETPYDSFGRLSYEMWRACRLVVDSGMHAKGWTRQQAIDFMVDNTALSLHNITSEVDRYITYPGQALAYKHGELKIRELRARAEKALGAKFDIREFHTVVLTNGSMPLTVLETIVDEWIAEQVNI